MCHAFSMELLLNMSIFSHKVNKPNHKIFVNTQRKTGAPITKTYSQHQTTATELSSSTPEAINQPSGSKSIFFFILQTIITQLLQHMPQECINFYVKHCCNSMSWRLGFYHSHPWKLKGRGSLCVAYGGKGQQAEGGHFLPQTYTTVFIGIPYPPCFWTLSTALSRVAEAHISGILF